jgi:2-methylcitrate dehydratase PrpD
VEVFGKLGRALNTGHYKRGWHATCTFGSIAATVVAASIMRLSASELTTAIGIAASAAGGLRVNFGTMMKPLHAGYAARNGVLAAQLARAGLTASDSSLEHRYGYAHVLAGASAPMLEWLASWGEPLEILTDYGLALKPFPACGATHPAIEAGMLLHHDIGGRTISDVRVGVCSMAFEPLIYMAPTTPLQGKFSMHYCVAAALLDGNVELATFTEARIADAAIASLIAKIRMETEPRFADDSEFPAIVTVTLSDGTVLQREVPLAMGKRARWPVRAQLLRKYSDCATASLGSQRVESTFERLSAIDSSMALADLVDTLQPNDMATA